jgi:hypothetical protein
VSSRDPDARVTMKRTKAISATRRIGRRRKTAALCDKIQAPDRSQPLLPMRVILRQKAVRVVLRRSETLSGWERNDAGW